MFCSLQSKKSTNHSSYMLLWSVYIVEVAWPCFLLESVLGHHGFTPRMRGLGSRAQMNACMVGGRSCIHSHQSTTSLTQTGTTTDTWSDLAYTFYTFAFLLIFNPNKT